jgi:hypothetical protein
LTETDERFMLTKPKTFAEHKLLLEKVLNKQPLLGKYSAEDGKTTVSVPVSDSITDEMQAMHATTWSAPLVLSDVSVVQMLARGLVRLRHGKWELGNMKWLFYEDKPFGEQTWCEQMGYTEALNGRNLILCSDLACLIDERQSCAVVYGAAHMPCVERFLLFNGFELVETKWVETIE